MKKSLSGACCLQSALFFFSLTATAQKVVPSSSEILYKPVQKTATVREDNQTLSRKIPAVKELGNLKRTVGITINSGPIETVAKPKEEQHVFVENKNLLSKAVLKTVNYNPSATADYCTPPSARQGCCYYWIRNMQSNSDELYAAPDGVFSTETATRNYYLSLKPETPFYVPFSESSVYAAGGWYYSNGSGHGSVDFLKTVGSYGPNIDPTFNVLAASDGKVISTGWVDLFGNYIIIEHKAPDGTIYRTGYFHLRNGYDHDIQKAKNVDVTSGDPAERDSLYVRYANKSTHTAQQWGTNSQKIKVAVNDNVYAGQHIAYAGNTGYGGAGWGLNSNADPYDPNTANNHLHFMLWIKCPANSNNISWLEIDPYGLYASITDANRDCLQAGVNKGFKSFFAPHFPSFHNVPLEVFVGGFGYFTGMGMGLQTLSVHKAGNSYYASGSFQYGLSDQWYCRVNMSSQQYQQYFDQYSAQGFVPGQISVCKDNNGNPLFTAIWRKLQAGEGTNCYHNLDDAGWNDAWNKHTGAAEKKSCVEHVRYQWNGKWFHAAVFSSINPGFYVYTGLSLADFQNKFDQLANEGYMPSNITAEEAGGSTTYGGVWVPAKNTYIALAELSPSAYQQKFDEMNGNGYRLYRIMGYSNSNKFIAIWIK